MGLRLLVHTMIGSNCHICSGAVIERSVIFEYSRLMDVRLVDKLVFGRYCVSKTGESIDLKPPLWIG